MRLSQQIQEQIKLYRDPNVSAYRFSFPKNAVRSIYSGRGVFPTWMFLNFIVATGMINPWAYLNSIHPNPIRNFFVIGCGELLSTYRTWLVGEHLITGHVNEFLSRFLVESAHFSILRKRRSFYWVTIGFIARFYPFHLPYIPTTVLDTLDRFIDSLIRSEMPIVMPTSPIPTFVCCSKSTATDRALIWLRLV